jgi:hypothetical protein
LRRRILVAGSAALIVIVVLSAVVGLEFFSGEAKKAPANLYVGVDVGFGDETDVYKVADAVQGFANLIIIGSQTVTRDTAKLTSTCNYLYDRGFSFIIYVSYGPVVPAGPSVEFFSSTVKQWGDKFLGVYIFDEPGGKQLDYAPGTQHYIDKPVKEAANFADAAYNYTQTIYDAIENITGPTFYNAPGLHLYTSDYALFWFDYLSGYNTVFTEFVGNQSRQVNVALCRGAAHVQNMKWGAMITWKYDQAPFLENPTELYQDMVTAYQNGADYIVVFDSPDNQSAITDLGILTSGQSSHLDAMQRFWNYAVDNPRSETDPATVAYVVPADYGFGFRGPDDTVWGLFAADALSSQIWNDIGLNSTSSLIAQYGKGLDIVCLTLTDGLQARLIYDKLIFWNGTVVGG